MKILLLTFYYPPDLSAGSFRAVAIADAIGGQLPDDSTLEVITTQPNRYHSFATEAPAHETQGKVSITRIVLPSHRSGMRDQSKAFLAFARRAARVAARDYDVVVATSSRLMTALLGAWIARRAGSRLYLDIRDIFVDTIGDVAPRRIAWATKPVFALLERWAVSRADVVNLVSRGFAGYFEPRYPRQRFTYHTNGVDDEFLVEETAPGRPAGARPLTVLYAGNLGEGQGLHAIIPELAKRMGSRIRFQIVGEGGRRVELERRLAASGVTNVELLAPVSRQALRALYRDADVLFAHLNDYDAFRKVLPSKLFEYAALGKPIWAGVAGYAAEFVRAEIDNATVFPPCDVDAAVVAFERLRLTDTPRPAFLARYSRANISRVMAADILGTVEERR